MSRARIDANTVRSAIGREVGQVGVLSPMGMETAGQLAVACTANRAYLARFVPSRDMAITKIAVCLVNAATNNDNCDVAIYNAALTTKIVSSGATAGKMNGSAGIQQIEVASTALTAGTTYYAAFAYGPVGGTAAKLVMTNAASSLFGNFFGSAAGATALAIQESGYTLPASITPTTTAFVPYMAVRES